MANLTFRANGKLLLTGEYFVLDGALALAVPTRLGQRLVIQKNSTNQLHWQSFNHEKQTWFSATFSLQDFSFQNATDAATAERLQQILTAIRQQNPTFLTDSQGFNLQTELEFPRLWGLGTSSTLLYALAKWAQVDPYQLLDATFGGSGYDIACAGTDVPIFYQKNNGQPTTEIVNFQPSFHENLHFVYLEKKQNSRSGIRRYRERVQEDRSLIDEISALTTAVAQSTQLGEFSDLLLQHEQLVARTIDLPRAQDLYFSDFKGVIKSLGAWGGDFILAANDWDNNQVKE